MYLNLVLINVKLTLFDLGSVKFNEIAFLHFAYLTFNSSRKSTKQVSVAVALETCICECAVWIGHNYAYTAMNPKSDTNYAHAVWIPYRTPIMLTRYESQIGHQFWLHGNESQIGHQLCSHGMNPESDTICAYTIWIPNRTPIMITRYESWIGHHLCLHDMNPKSDITYAHAVWIPIRLPIMLTDIFHGFSFTVSLSRKISV
jgi:hypothetical protein